VTEFKVPELGENVASGDVAKVLVSVGDTVKMEQPVIELETDKATIEVPSSVAGVVKEIKVKKGDKVQVGAVIFTVDDGAASGNGASGNGAAKPPPRPNPRRKPSRSRNRAETRAEGRGQARTAESGADAAASAGRGAAGSRSTRGCSACAVERRARRGLAGRAPPGARDRRGHQCRRWHWSRGRISQEDVKEHARRILSSVGSAGASAAGGAMAARGSRPMPDFAKWGEVQREAWSNIRRVTSEHLSYSWNTVPHVTQFDKADVTALEELRKKYKDQVVKAGGNLTVTAMLVKILATALQKFPQFNASIDPDRGEIIYKKYVSVGVAVDTDRGLLVPVIKDANRKNITQIAVELQQLAEKARDRKLTVDEMSGGSMSLSNLGGIGGTYFTPIVNWPEVAILGVSRGGTEPVWKDGQFVPQADVAAVTSYDHRLIDGADAIRFLRWVVEAIEQPFLLSLIG
jgi:pyruvate dehydrogenase E2 component (dihydrolipoamide acetyltransferase)